MNAEEVRESLAFSEYARKRARDDMARPWLALVLLGSLSVASLSLTEAAAVTPTGLFWVFAGPLGAGAITLYAYRRNRSSGIESSPVAYVAITLGLIVLSYAAARIAFAFGIPAFGRGGPALVVAAGYVALAWIERSWIVAAVSLALVAVTVVIIGLDLTGQQSKALMFGLYGLALLAIGFNLRLGRHQLS
jgi:hypothetical protein